MRQRSERAARRAGRAVAAALVAATAVAGCTGASPAPGPSSPGPPNVAGTVAPPGRITSWVYQLQGYPGGRLDALAGAAHQLAVVDLARDGHGDYFTADEIATLRQRGKRVLAYFEIGAVEEFRPEYAALREHAADLMLNIWPEWPDEHFVRYWDERWWQRVVRPRVDQAMRAGFDGVYLDVPLAYEEIDLARLPGWTRHALGQAMTNLIVRISRYAKAQRPGFWIVPQNSPELRRYPGYTAAVDGIGVEELFYRATDTPCRADFCAENLANVRALHRAGKFVLAVDYAGRPELVRDACARYRAEGFAGYLTVLALDRVGPPC